MSNSKTDKRMQNKSENKIPGILFVVATPIGNLQDITVRALETLKTVDLVLCEDTRKAAILLKHYEIKVKTRNYNDHSTKHDRDNIIHMLSEGKNLALISDAGTPLISDPGFKLVAQCQDEGIDVIPIPGVSAPIAALSACGLPTDKFMFGGFLPTTMGKLHSALIELKSFDGTIVLFESPRRLQRLISVVLKVLGNRRMVVARELTKHFEQFIRTDCENFVKQYKEHEFIGEIVVIIAPAQPISFQEDQGLQSQELLAALLVQGISTKEAVHMVAAKTGLPKKHLYTQALALKTDAVS
jgi:16S rRNA (cytidine1402-2'-O)-methyltransferase